MSKNYIWGRTNYFQCICDLRGNTTIAGIPQIFLNDLNLNTDAKHNFASHRLQSKSRIANESWKHDWRSDWLLEILYQLSIKNLFGQGKLRRYLSHGLLLKDFVYQSSFSVTSFWSPMFTKFAQQTTRKWTRTCQRGPFWPKLDDWILWWRQKMQVLDRI